MVESSSAGAHEIKCGARRGLDVWGKGRGGLDSATRGLGLRLVPGARGKEGGVKATTEQGVPYRRAAV